MKFWNKCSIFNYLFQFLWIWVILIDKYESGISNDLRDTKRLDILKGTGYESFIFCESRLVNRGNITSIIYNTGYE